MKKLILFYLVFLIPSATYAITPKEIINGNSAVINNESDFKTFINGVSSGYRKWLITVPYVVKLIPSNKSNQLRDALSLALLKSPLETINTLNRIDKIISAKGHSLPMDKFGSDSVCVAMIDINKYDRGSYFQYYFLAKSSLEKIGKKGQYCLELMNDYVEEITYQEKAGKMTWGNEKYHFYTQDTSRCLNQNVCQR